MTIPIPPQIRWLPSRDRGGRRAFPALAAVALTLVLGRSADAAATAVHHALSVRLSPAEGTLEAEDRVTLPDPAPAVELTLHAGLSPRAEDPGTTIESLGPTVGEVPLERYRVRLPQGRATFTLRYGGSIQHPVQNVASEGSRPMPTTPGTIEARAVYLDGGSGWYPRLGTDPVTFSLAVDIPPGWQSVSQGRRQAAEAAGASTRWQEDRPQDQIYLVAGPFTLYRQPTAWGEALVYLREDEPDLARRYLEATERYVSLYARLIGPYPYDKFALVENAWETGYGMPSFTLLGSRVLRLPFIPTTSYPHEVLHNWWGNAVFVDYARGNWAEGLTSYLADHLLQEERGEGALHRRAALQKYADYVGEAEDFPLAAFRGRHSEATQAVGYNKALMLFHMLRVEIGDAAFVEGLRRFYAEQRGRTAGYRDLRRAFEAASGRRLGDFFEQWVDRVGAPWLELGDVQVAEGDGGYRVSGRLRQTQPGPAYRLSVPLALQAEGEDLAMLVRVEMDGTETGFALQSRSRPLRLQVDPELDLFRRLDPREVPASLGRLFGAQDPLLVLPSAASSALREAFEGLARGWTRDPSALRWDAELESLPDDRPIWLLGWENRWRGALAGELARLGVSVSERAVGLPGGEARRGERAVALALPRRERVGLAIGWIASDNPASVPGLARKLPHYGRFSYLAFDEPRLAAVSQGQWPVLDTPLSIALDPAGEPVAVRTPPREPLARWADSAGSPTPGRPHADRLSSPEKAAGDSAQPRAEGGPP
jgi:hypothetical protein